MQVDRETDRHVHSKTVNHYWRQSNYYNFMHNVHYTVIEQTGKLYC